MAVHLPASPLGGDGDYPARARTAAVGELRGKVVEIGITYVRLDTPDGPVHLPNSQVLASAIAPVVSKPPDQT